PRRPFPPVRRLRPSGSPAARGHGGVPLFIAKRPRGATAAAGTAGRWRCPARGRPGKITAEGGHDMASEHFDRLLTEAKALPRDEQERLRNLLDYWLAIPPAQPRSKSDETNERMLKAGTISRVPPPLTDLARYRDRRPVEIQGEPLSETIIRERG